LGKILLLGLHKRQLDAYRRLCLPAPWCIGGARVWLLFPEGIVPPYNQASHSLCLLPVNEPALRHLIATSQTQVMGTPTPELALGVLRSHARLHAFDPKVATVIRTTPSIFRFTLTQAQLGWLGCRGRILVFIGAVSTARVYTPADWAKIERQDRPKFP
jgi:hypothetical protein